MPGLQSPSLICPCNEDKTHCLLLDGGLKYGQYHLRLCDECYENEDKRFVISEETLQ